MEENKIRIGITQGDINGVGYEVILKTFSDPTMLELCTPIIYGSPKVAAYHRKALDVQANFSIVNTASEAGYNRLSVVNCTDDEVKVEFSKPDPEAGKAALGALERAIEEYREGLIDVIVTAPINKHTIQSKENSSDWMVCLLIGAVTMTSISPALYSSIAFSKAPRAALPASESGLENSTFTSSSVQFTTLKRSGAASDAEFTILKLVGKSNDLR